MSLKLNKFVPPDHAHVKFDFEKGTPVRVRNRWGEVFEGKVIYAMSGLGRESGLELVNVVKITPQIQPMRPIDFMRFDQDELQTVAAIGPSNIVRFNRPIELIYRVVMVDDAEKFDILEAELLTKKPTEVGLYFCGLDVGRKGELYYIAVLILDTIVIIDCEEMISHYERYLGRLDVLLFSNEDIVKVAFNSRHIADYLYHFESIYLKNIFDIQVTEFYLWARGQPANQLKQTSSDLKYKRLNECMEEFLDPAHLVEEELAALREFEGKEFTETTHPMVNSPFVDKSAQKWVILQVKHLLRLREAMMKRMFELLTDVTTANVSDHVACRPFDTRYDISDELAIPPTVVKKLIPSPGGSGASNRSTPDDQASFNNQATADTETAVDVEADSTTVDEATASGSNGSPTP
ncbi:unnamed protein product [Orchesella dallaii]|uniref:3'-5' exonuclease domain-containing protein n=1 Tax=Orchesella dallaii TaxID=48710 RepID=A0ABP1RW46_9HEXA